MCVICLLRATRRETLKEARLALYKIGQLSLMQMDNPEDKALVDKFANAHANYIMALMEIYGKKLKDPSKEDEVRDKLIGALMYSISEEAKEAKLREVEADMPPELRELIRMMREYGANVEIQKLTEKEFIEKFKEAGNVTESESESESDDFRDMASKIFHHDK